MFVGDSDLGHVLLLRDLPHMPADQMPNLPFDVVARFNRHSTDVVRLWPPYGDDVALQVFQVIARRPTNQDRARDPFAVRAIEVARVTHLPPSERQNLGRSGHGCLLAETSIGA